MKKTANEIKERIREKVTVCDIILWGYGDEAKKFYNEYKEVLKIKGCVTDDRRHPDFLDDEQKIPIIEWNNYAGDKNEYIVICSLKLAYIENQIMASGLQIFEEYVAFQIVKVILSDKKIAIMVGNCQMSMMYDFLKESKSFAEQYELYRLRSHYWESRWALKIISFLRGLCDLYICIKHEDEDEKFFRKEELPENCKIVTVTTAILRLYWPQLKVNLRNAQNEYYIANKEKMWHSPFEYADSNINRMIAEGKTIEEIVSLLTSENFYSKEEVNKHIEMTFRMAEYQEDECDIKIASYIKENYQKEMLYRDMTHMQTDLVWEMVKRIVEHLGMDTTEIEEMRKDTENPVNRMYSNHCTEIPVYPSVAKHLGLEWCNKDTLFIVTNYNGVKKITFEEYIRAYYSVCSKIKQIREEW